MVWFDSSQAALRYVCVLTILCKTSSLHIVARYVGDAKKVRAQSDSVEGSTHVIRRIISDLRQGVLVAESICFDAASVFFGLSV